MTLSTGELDFVRDLVYRRSAIVLDDTKQYLIETRLAQVARTNGFGSVGELVQSARGGARAPALHTALVEAITTHETSFFRDLQPFEALRAEILPALVAARATRRALNIWCAACSSGQEPYSVAMTILEHFPELERWPVRIVGTDLSHQIVDSAREGRFRQIDVNRGLPVKLLLRHFDRIGNDWQANARLRAMVTFQQMNLLDAWQLPFVPDIVFLRNVLIYFDVETKRRLLKRAREGLAADGVMFLGVAESTLGLDDGWQRMPFGASVYFRKRP